VAIEGSADFDVIQVDTTTVQFGPANAEVYSIVPGNNDHNGDGYDDLRVKFNIPDTGITCDYPDDVTLIGTADGVVFVGSDSITTAACDVSVEIDVQPDDDTNFVNTDGGNGDLMQVAIEGSADFDVIQVDTTTVQFGPANAEVYSVVPGNNDDNGDGYDDLRVEFNIADTGITCDYPDDVTLTGTADGVVFAGFDSITTTTCDASGCHP
jgi:hypothetical protein